MKKQEKVHCIIDGDILVYRIGFTTQEETEGIARSRMDTSINEICDAMEADSFKIYLTSTDKSNFRFALFPEYKAHRKAERPVHYNALREFLVEYYDTVMSVGQEADDEMAIDALKMGDEAIICTIDKDLDQIPGWHYNWVHGRKYWISTKESERSFYTQCLVGDTSDNIKGCPGIGQVKAQRRLEGCKNEKEMLNQVVLAYAVAYPKSLWADHLLLAGRLLWLRRSPNQEWMLSSDVPASKIALETFYETGKYPSSMNPMKSNTSSQNEKEPTIQTSN